MKRGLLLTSVLAVTLFAAGCTTDRYGRTRAAGCDSGTNYATGAAGAIAGGLLGSAIGGGSGQVIATGAGAGIGAIAGSKSRLGC